MSFCVFFKRALSKRVRQAGQKMPYCVLLRQTISIICPICYAATHRANSSITGIPNDLRSSGKGRSADCLRRTMGGIGTTGASAMTNLLILSEGDGNGKYVPRQRNPLNASGPFYTEDVCLACCLPEGEAPDLMGFEEDLENPMFGCFFKKQPETLEELDRAFSAMEVNCIDTLRYAGSDPAILRRLQELGMKSQCDHSLPKPPVTL